LPLSSADPEKEQLELAKTKAAANLRRLKKENDDSDRESDSGGKKSMSKGIRKQDLALNQYENQIALDVVAPEDIPVGFEGNIEEARGIMSLMCHRYRRTRRYYRGT
jgi:hypothetical protein